MGGFLYIHLGLINAAFAPYYHLFLALLENKSTNSTDLVFVCMCSVLELSGILQLMIQSLVSFKSIYITSALGVVR